MLAFVGGFVLLIVSTVMSGLVLAQLWAWFLVPTLKLPLIGIPQALGISLTWGYLNSALARDKHDDESFGWLLFRSIVTGLLFLAFGFIFKQFMPV